MARLVSASSRLGVLKPARTSMPCTPMKKASTCRLRSADTATGPTSASDGVRSPPVRTTEVVGVAGAVQHVGDRDRVGDDGEVGDAGEVRGRARGWWCRPRRRWPCRAPPARRPRRRWPASRGVAAPTSRRSPAPSTTARRTASAPPCTFSSRPSRCSARCRGARSCRRRRAARRGRRRAPPPSRLSSARMAARRWPASIRPPAPTSPRGRRRPRRRQAQVAGRPRGRRPGRCRARGPARRRRCG